MDKKQIIIVDTDIIIKAFRGNKELEDELRSIKSNVVISAITAFELYQGVQSPRRVIELNKQLKVFSIVHLNEQISQKALSLFKTYKSRETLLVGDTLIAATALLNNYKLFTDNKKDFSFIKELRFY